MARLVSLRVDPDRFAALCERTSDAAEAETWRGASGGAAREVEARAWDGAWYLRAFHDDGSLLGSAKARECRIDSIAQSWAVALRERRRPRSRARRGVRAADEQTRSRGGPARPAAAGLRSTARSTTPDTFARTRRAFARTAGSTRTPRRGSAGRTPALGDGKRAERIFRLLNPVLRTRTAENRVATASSRTCSPATSTAVRPGSAAGAGPGTRARPRGCGASASRPSSAFEKRTVTSASTRAFPRVGRDSKRGFASAKSAFTSWSRTPTRSARGVAAMTLDGAPLDSSRIALHPGRTGTREVRVRLGSPSASTITLKASTR